MKWRGLLAAFAVLVGCGKTSDGAPAPSAATSAQPVATASSSRSADSPTSSAAVPVVNLPPSARRALTAYERDDWIYLQRLADEGVVPEHQLVKWKQSPNRLGAQLGQRLGAGDNPCTTYRYRTGPRDRDALFHELHLSVCGPEKKLKSMYVFGW